MNEIRPLGSQVLLQLYPPGKRGDIILSRCAQYPMAGLVKNLGRKVNGGLKRGDIVLFEPGDLPIREDSAMLFIDEGDILAVIDQDVLKELLAIK